MGKVSASFLAVLSLLWYAVSGNEQHFACKHIEDVFHESETTEVTPRFRARQGPPGKMGPQGVRGERGLPGNAGKPGNVDYNRINGTISEKVTHALKEMKSTIEELKTNCSDFLAEWEEMKPTVVELKRKRDSESNCIGQRGLFTFGKCYIVPRISSSQDKTYDEAVADCAKFGALVAEVHDRIEQKALFDFVITKMPAGQSHARMWLGMKYASTTSTLRYRTGKEINMNQFLWHTGSPTAKTSYKYMIMSVRSDSNPNVGVWNYYKSYTIHGVICEKRT